jgi:two-component system NarL family sensor kinase
LLSIAVERPHLFERSNQTGAVEERYRLARELHDTLGQGLTAVLLHLESIDALLEADADRSKIRRQMAQVLELTRANIEEARRSVLDLRAAPLEGQTLVEAIQDLADEYAQSSGLQIRFEHIDGQRPLPARFEAGLYRIAQEALNNIVRHTEARTARIELVATPDTITSDHRGRRLRFHAGPNSCRPLRPGGPQ